MIKSPLATPSSTQTRVSPALLRVVVSPTIVPAIFSSIVVYPTFQVEVFPSFLIMFIFKSPPTPFSKGREVVFPTFFDADSRSFLTVVFPTFRSPLYEFRQLIRVMPKWELTIPSTPVIYSPRSIIIYRVARV